jgi:Predicted phosphatase/phosphohexomutase
MAKRDIKAVVFDFDGTLTPLTLDFSLLRAQVLAVAREYVDDKTLSALDHPHIIETIYAVEEKAGERGGEFRERAFDRLRGLELEAAHGKDVYPYTRHVLSELKRRGMRTGIITRTCTAVLRAVFSDMDGYVDGFVTRDHIREVKPHPAQAIEMAHRLSVAPGEVVLV